MLLALHRLDFCFARVRPEQFRLWQLKVEADSFDKGTAQRGPAGGHAAEIALEVAGHLV